MNMNEALQQSLYDKLSREQDKYRDWLKGQPPEEILHHSYEYTVREDILMSMEELTLSEAETRALLLSPSPMAILYDKFSDLETGYMDTIRDSIEETAKDEAKKLRELDKDGKLNGDVIDGILSEKKKEDAYYILYSFVANLISFGAGLFLAAKLPGMF